MTYDVMGRRVLDYDFCTYSGSRLYVRGPQKDLSKPYVAFLGATETFGKFIAEPFPDLLADHLPAQSLNLGMINGGLDAYLKDEAILQVARKAELRVVQVMGALNLSNHFFTVHPRRNDRLIAPREPLVQLFPEVDFAEFHYTKAMLNALQRQSRERYALVCRELQDMWLARMTMLLCKLGGPTALLWFADQPPPEDALAAPNDPMLIDADLIKHIRKKADGYVVVVPDDKIRARGTEGMLFGAMEEPAAAQLMGPAAHENAALALQETCLHLLG